MAQTIRTDAPIVQFPASFRGKKHANGPRRTGSDGSREGGTLKFERRAEVRCAAEGVVIATYRGGCDADSPTRFGITHLELLDRSPGGVGVLSQTPLPPGTLVTICPPGSGVPWLSAVSVRCETHADGHSVGLRLSPRRAA